MRRVSQPYEQVQSATNNRKSQTNLLFGFRKRLDLFLIFGIVVRWLSLTGCGFSFALLWLGFVFWRGRGRLSCEESAVRASPLVFVAKSRHTLGLEPRND
ncbi:hypothetical protein BDV93DRAFT_45373 [Ceratobasidium sp. AG-I]|nr:hypothetical protein BDV93DRAFT_45373 [Ceratobasidium sp. AG-I]